MVERFGIFSLHIWLEAVNVDSTHQNQWSMLDKSRIFCGLVIFRVFQIPLSSYANWFEFSVCAVYMIVLKKKACNLILAIKQSGHIDFFSSFSSLLRPGNIFILEARDDGKCRPTEQLPVYCTALLNIIVLLFQVWLWRK